MCTSIRDTDTFFPDFDDDTQLDAMASDILATEARRSDKPMLYWGEPDVSVWPTTTAPLTLH